MGEIVNATNNTFLSLIKNESHVVIVDFYADWCRPCQAMSMIFEKLVPSEPTIKVVKVNIDTYPEIADKFHVTKLPTILFIKNNKVVLKKEELLNEVAIRRILRSLP